MNQANWILVGQQVVGWGFLVFLVCQGLGV